MLRKRTIALALAVALGGQAAARAQTITPAPAGTAQTAPASVPMTMRATLGVPNVQAYTAPTVGTALIPVQAPAGAPAQGTPAPGTVTPGTGDPSNGTPGTPEGMGAGGDPAESRGFANAAEGSQPEAEPALGPTPLTKVGILQKALFGEEADKTRYHISGWIDADYTFRSTGPGQNNVAPVMNRFGDEALMRQMGLFLSRSLDSKTWSWGFNVIWFAGSDAAFLQPTAGYPAQTNPRFGESFTDLNLTAHLPILTEGGVDVKVGRQTTCLGPMGALAWQRPLNSSDYAWYNLEEGRYTGVSSVWYISKQLSWYNGVEIGGWGVFFDDPVHGLDYLTQITYWLDEDAKKTKVWTTVLTGPTGHFMNGNTTTFELGVLHNWNKYIYQIVDTQMTWSKAGVFSAPDPTYRERAYDVYTYIGVHLNCQWDLTTRLEWYKDVDGRDYPGGFGRPHTDYYETTVGLNYHPTRWVEFRPEIRYDHASNPNFGASNSQRNQLTISGDVLLKF